MSGTMEAPESGIKVRMYRQGHGDCFLLATKKRSGEPFYMLIDCGLKPNSEVPDGNGNPQPLSAIIADIGESTGNRLDVVLITHEHQDHVNGFAAKPEGRGAKPYWDAIGVGQVWLAWTEDSRDRFANDLRKRFNDTLFGLIGAVNRMENYAVVSGDRLERIRDLISLETGEESLGRDFRSAARGRANPGVSDLAALAVAGVSNKNAMKYMRDKAEKRPLFLRPDRGPYFFPDVEGIKVYPLGPPRNLELLLSLDPKATEEFKLGIVLDGTSRSFFAATEAGLGMKVATPFAARFGHTRERAPKSSSKAGTRRREVTEFWNTMYPESDGEESAWRKIDSDWLEPAEALALRLNSEVNNTSLAIAIELPDTGKVLLFTGDAQRGNWMSWSKLKWSSDESMVTAKDLLRRTVFYKVGHHGSHNATLNGSEDDDYANLDWMGKGEYADEFVAMIPANTKWALEKRPTPWKHPLKAIEDALIEKARGRVFRTDIRKLKKPSGTSTEEWRRFKKRVGETDLYVEYTVE